MQPYTHTDRRTHKQTDIVCITASAQRSATQSSAQIDAISGRLQDDYIKRATANAGVQ